MVGSILWEYFLPLTSDQYVMENQIVSFFYELIIIPNKNYYNLIMQTIDVHFSTDELLAFV